ncbi:MAG: 1-acyl-sn-glycerol-3-phosphate acyltransferase [Sandaracinaceae bacterium]|nr:1-acyl-sn-glycerol-3-phosphate acyltransferase [Sandaracinaceae bacterium]
MKSMRPNVIDMHRRAEIHLDEPTLKDKLISVALWGAGIAWIVPMMGSMTLLSMVTTPKKLDWLSRIYTRGQVFLTGSRLRVHVHPDVDPNGVYMFVQNHTNHFDHVTSYAATPQFKQGLELESHFKYPVYGWFMTARGTIPVRPGKEGQSPRIMKRMQEEVDAGHSILAFPEGTRTRDGRVGRFRSGVFFMARDLGISVVPISVTGMYEVMHKGSLVIRPGQTVTIHVGAPISMKGLSDDQVRVRTEEVRGIIAAHVDRHWEERARQRGELEVS